MSTTSTIRVQVSNQTGHIRKYAAVPRDASVSELIAAVIPTLNLPMNDSAGRPLYYTMRHDESGRQMSNGEIIADTVLEDNTLRLMPDITPG